MALNKWQRLIVLLGSMGFFGWALHVIQDEPSPHPEVSLLSGILLAVWAATSKNDGEEWLPHLSKLKRAQVITLVVVAVAISIAMTFSDSIFSEKPAEEATEMAMETPEVTKEAPLEAPDLIRPAVSVEQSSQNTPAPSKIDPYERIYREMKENAEPSDPVSKAMQQLQSNKEGLSEQAREGQR